VSHTLFFCQQIDPDDPTAIAIPRVAFGDHTAFWPTPNGSIQVQSFVASTAATKTVVGAVSPNGDLLFTAKHGGIIGNGLRVELTAGATGAGNENRTLDCVVSGLDYSIVFGTDGAGASVVPTAQQVEDMIAAHTDELVAGRIEAVAQGDGSGAVQVTAYTNLEGGADDGTQWKTSFGTHRCSRVEE
jgi:hypothetical protein